MSVGSQPTNATIDNQLTSLAQRMRDVMNDVTKLYTQVTNGVLGNGQVTLESYGYTAGDATTALNLISYMQTVAQVYRGQVQAQGTGGTGAVDFNFDNALSVLWNGQ